MYECLGLFEIVVTLAAMKKRNRESASPSIPNSKKLNHTMNGIESPKRDGVNKPKPYLVVISIFYFNIFFMFAFSVQNFDTYT